MSGEKPELYDSLWSRVAVAVDPKDIIEWIYVTDVVDLTWEIHRYRRFAAAIIDNSQAAVRNTLIDLGSVPYEQLQSLIRIMELAAPPSAKESPNDREAARDLLDVDETSVAAESFKQNIGSLETIERITAAAESRREKVLREIERHRESFGQRMRKVLQSSDNDSRKLAKPEEKPHSAPPNK